MANKTEVRNSRWSHGVTVLFLVAVMCVRTREAAPIGNITELTQYLFNLGWLDEQDPTEPDMVADAIKEFQTFFGLPTTGEFDRGTTAIMSVPRCGFKDKLVEKSENGSEYKLAGSMWSHRDLTYRINQYSRKLPREVVDEAIGRAFQAWSRYTDLTFTRKQYGPVDINIRFAIGAHGDGDPFNGPGGVLAHAYYPAYGGEIHFDDSESWTVRHLRGVNLFHVAAHEIGHALGLQHSNVRAALMWPWAGPVADDNVFHYDDIAGIQALYGRRRRRYGIRMTTEAYPDDLDGETINNPPVYNPGPRNRGGNGRTVWNQLYQYVNSWFPNLA